MRSSLLQAFVKLESMEGLPEKKRQAFELLAMQIFSKSDCIHS
jgi:hypothetical protein